MKCYLSHGKIDSAWKIVLYDYEENGFLPRINDEHADCFSAEVKCSYLWW